MATNSSPTYLPPELNVPVGAVVKMPEQVGDTFEAAGATFLRSGLFETDPENYDVSRFSEPLTRGTRSEQELSVTGTTVDPSCEAISFDSTGQYGIAIINHSGGSAIFWTGTYGRDWVRVRTGITGATAGAAAHVCDVTKRAAASFRENTEGTIIAVVTPAGQQLVHTDAANSNQPITDVYSQNGVTWVVLTQSATLHAYRSTNSGASWSKFTLSANHDKLWTRDDVTWLAYGAVSATTVQRSTDGGATWGNSTVWGSARITRDIDSANDGSRIVAVASSGSDVARSVNSALSWATATYENSPSLDVVRVHVSDDGNSVMTLSSTAGVDRNQISTNGGVTWVSGGANATFAVAPQRGHGRKLGCVTPDGDVLTFLTATPGGSFAYLMNGFSLSGASLIPVELRNKFDTESDAQALALDRHTPPSRISSFINGPNYDAESDRRTISFYLYSFITGGGGMFAFTDPGYNLYVRIK